MKKSILVTNENTTFIFDWDSLVDVCPRGFRIYEGKGIFLFSDDPDVVHQCYKFIKEVWLGLDPYLPNVIMCENEKRVTVRFEKKGRSVLITKDILRNPQPSVTLSSKMIEEFIAPKMS